MKSETAISVMVVFGLAWLVAGCASTNTLAVQEAGYPQDKVDARALFAENCATCHGQDGRARTFHGWLLGAQDFTDLTWQASDADVIHAINTGPGMMPSFKNKLSAAEIGALAAYVRTFKSAP
jgi:mono/diheme cytochrome c family protein